jgi:hypothetical protein
MSVMFHNKRLLVVVFVTLVSSNLVVQQSMFGSGVVYGSEQSPYQSGYDHGCDDAGISNPGDRYINQPEKGPAFHTDEFMQGYDAGFNACRSGGGGGGDFYEPGPDFNQGPGGFQDSGERYYEGFDWRQICDDVQDFLSENCDDLVTSDGYALTLEGKAALERIACGGQAILGVLLTNNLLAALQGLRCQ